MKKFFITGVMGFVGFHWANNLLKNGHKIIGIDTNITPTKLLENKNFEFVNESILENKSKLSELIGKSDYVLHLASIAEPDRYLSHPKTVIDISAFASIEIIKLCIKHKKKIFFTSTSEIYGKNLKIPFSENDDRHLGPTSIKRWCYSSSKALIEHYLEACSFQDNLEFRVVRLFNIYGPNLKNRVISRFIENALLNKDLEINNGGNQTRCFTYIDDAIDAFNLIIESDRCKNQIFNVGNTSEISIKDLANKIVQISNSKSKIKSKSYLEQFGNSYEDIERRVPSVKKLKDFMGWEAKIDLDEGLRRTIDYCKSN